MDSRIDHDTKPVPKTCGQKTLGALRSNFLVVLLIISLLLGIIIGSCLRLREEPYSVREVLYLRFPGDLFMNMLKVLILPLIVASLVSGITSLDSRTSGKMGCRSFVYYLATTLAAVILGIILVLIIGPGRQGDKPVITGKFRDVEAIDAFLDLVRQMFPDNIVKATFSKYVTVLVPASAPVTTTTTSPGSSANATSPPPQKPAMVPKKSEEDGMNMMGLVVFAIVMGIAINKVGMKGKPLKDFFDSLSEVTVVLIKAVIWYSPIGVMFLVIKDIVIMKNPAQTFEQLSFYFLTVMLGLFIHGFITLPFVYFVIVRRNPYTFLMGMLQALVTALGTASSSATLPITMRNLEEIGVDPRVIAFVAPVGATLNMDGTALYEAVAVIFIGQVEGYDMDFGKIIIVCVTATLAAIGAAGVPQAGLVTMVIVLSAVGFPADKVGLILSIDWLLDRFRTAINVLGDAYGAGIVHYLSIFDLMKMDKEDEICKLEMEVSVPSENEDGVTKEKEVSVPKVKKEVNLPQVLEQNKVAPQSPQGSQVDQGVEHDDI